MAASTNNSTLELLKGSTTPFLVELVNLLDQAEDLAGSTAASFAMYADLAAAAVLTRTTTAGTLTLEAGASRVKGTLTQPEADALVPGLYVAQVAIKFGATDWRMTKYFFVNVIKDLAPRS